MRDTSAPAGYGLLPGNRPDDGVVVAPSGRDDPARPAPADRLPRPPGRRRPGFAALAILLVVGSAAAAGVLAIRVDQRTPVLVARTDLAVGHQVTRDDLAVARVAASGVTLIPADSAGQVIGRYVGQDIPTGRLLESRMFVATGLLTSGYSAIGVPLVSGRAPASGLHSGDEVNVVRAVDGEGTLLVRNAVVGAVSQPQSHGFGSSATGDTIVTIIVPDDQGGSPGSLSTKIAAAAAAGQIVLVLTARGSA